MPKKPLLAAFLLSALPALHAQEFRAFGPLDLCEGQQVALNAYNPSSITRSIEIELVDAATALTIDRGLFSLAGRRGGNLAFSSRRVLGASAELPKPDCRSTKRVVALVEAERGILLHPGMHSGMSSAITADQKTIIGGFKSMSGMDSETEVIECVSRPFQLVADASIALFARSADRAPVDVQIVHTTDGKVIGSWTTGGQTAKTQEGWSHTHTFTVEVKSPRDPGSGVPTAPASAPVVLRFQVRGQATVAVAVQQSAANQVAIETLEISHAGLDLD